GFHKKSAAVLKFVNTVSNGVPFVFADQHTRNTARDGPFPWFKSFETVCHNSFTGSCCKNIVPQANNTTTWNFEFHVNKIAFGLHYKHVAFALANEVDHFA